MDQDVRDKSTFSSSFKGRSDELDNENDEWK